MSFFSHDSAVIDDGAIIGDGTKIWHFVHVSGNSEIGNDCSIGQNVYIANNVKIGNRVKIQNNVSVFENVILEDDVFCGPSMVFTNVINPRAFVERKNEFMDTVIQKGATLGANCTIICGVVVSSYAFIGAGTVVTKDVPQYALVVGNPGKQIGWRSEYGEKLDLPLEGSGKASCPATGEIYELIGGQIKKV